MKSITLAVLLLAFVAIALSQTVYQMTDADKQQFLDLQNTARAQVDPASNSPLNQFTWDDTLQQKAEDYFSQNCAMVHSNLGYGENLSGSSGSAKPDWISAMVGLWTAEKQYYDYDTNACTGGKECRHYTQVIWNNSVRIGCARLDGCSASLGLFVACEYDPPGNFVGEKPYVAAAQGVSPSVAAASPSTLASPSTVASTSKSSSKSASKSESNSAAAAASKSGSKSESNSAAAAASSKSAAKTSTDGNASASSAISSRVAKSRRDPAKSPGARRVCRRACRDTNRACKAAGGDKTECRATKATCLASC